MISDLLQIDWQYVRYDRNRTVFCIIARSHFIFRESCEVYRSVKTHIVTYYNKHSIKYLLDDDLIVLCKTAGPCQIMRQRAEEAFRYMQLSTQFLSSQTLTWK